MQGIAPNNQSINFLQIAIRDTLVGALMIWFSGQHLYSQDWWTLDSAQRDQAYEAIAAQRRPILVITKETEAIKELLRVTPQVDILAANKSKLYTQKLGLAWISFVPAVLTKPMSYMNAMM